MIATIIADEHTASVKWHTLFAFRGDLETLKQAHTLSGEIFGHNQLKL